MIFLLQSEQENLATQLYQNYLRIFGQEGVPFAELPAEERSKWVELSATTNTNLAHSQLMGPELKFDEDGNMAYVFQSTDACKHFIELEFVKPFERYFDEYGITGGDVLDLCYHILSVFEYSDPREEFGGYRQLGEKDKAVLYMLVEKGNEAHVAYAVNNLSCHDPGEIEQFIQGFKNPKLIPQTFIDGLSELVGGTTAGQRIIELIFKTVKESL